MILSKVVPVIIGFGGEGGGPGLVTVGGGGAGLVTVGGFGFFFRVSSSKPDQYPSFLTLLPVQVHSQVDDNPATSIKTRHDYT